MALTADGGSRFPDCSGSELGRWWYPLGLCLTSALSGPVMMLSDVDESYTFGTRQRALFVMSDKVTIGKLIQ